MQQVSFWPENDENGGSESTFSSQLRKTRSMDNSSLELRMCQTNGVNHDSSIHNNANLSKARSEANIHSSTLSLGHGKY